jgi:hypothetical protein
MQVLPVLQVEERSDSGLCMFCKFCKLRSEATRDRTCMVTVVIMAKEFGSDDRLATGNVFVSTIISILTLPLVVMVLERLA